MTTTTDFRLYAAGLAALLAVSAIFAMLFGYISPDSWYYILIADGLRHGHGCSVNGEYTAVYPCGYPAILALTAPVDTLSGLMVSSKVTNLLLLLGCFWLVFKASRHILMATLVVLNPVTLNLAMYTWSENLLLFCVCATVYAFKAIEDHPDRVWPVAVMTGALILGCFARYIFGPLAFVLFVCCALTFGRKTALRALPAFALAGVVYLGYQDMNLRLTGHGTGMARIPAPEAPLYLLRQFLYATFSNGAMVAIAAVLLVLASLKQWRVTRTGRDAAASYILIAGAGFLLLALTLRLRTQFDPFNTRTLGYGVVLIAAGLVGRHVERREQSGAETWPMLALLACGVFAVLFASGFEIPGDLADMVSDDGYVFPATALDQLTRHGPHYETIVTFRLPVPTMDDANVDNIEDLYYGAGTSLVSPGAWPGPRDTAKAFLRRLDDEDTDSCVFDFTAFANMDDLRTFLASGVVTDHRLWTHPGTVTIPVFDPSLSAYILSIAQPGKEVPCNDILDLPQTHAVQAQAALAMP